MNGEGFAYFRWSTFMKMKWVQRAHWESLKGWPTRVEWREVQRRAAQRRSPE